MSDVSVGSNGWNGNTSKEYVIDRCRQDPELADAVHSLLDVCEQMDHEDPGASVEFVRAIKDMGDYRRQAREVQ